MGSPLTFMIEGEENENQIEVVQSSPDDYSPLECTPECPQPEVEEYDYAYADSAPPSRDQPRSIDKRHNNNGRNQNSRKNNNFQNGGNNKRNQAQPAWKQASSSNNRRTTPPTVNDYSYDYEYFNAGDEYEHSNDYNEYGSSNEHDDYGSSNDNDDYGSSNNHHNG